MLKRSRPCARMPVMASVIAALVGSTAVRADEGGVPFWFSGQYASMAAVAPTPGWTVTMLPYYYNGSADNSKAFAKGSTLVTNVDSHLGLMNAQLGYAWDTMVLNGVPMMGLSWGAGNNGTSSNLLATVPSASLQRISSDSVTGGTDLYPIATLSWS